jgi:hypothetical protein
MDRLALPVVDGTIACHRSGGGSRRAGKIDMADDSPVIKEIFIDARHGSLKMR